MWMAVDGVYMAANMQADRIMDLTRSATRAFPTMTAPRTATPAGFVSGLRRIAAGQLALIQGDACTPAHAS